MGWATEKSDGKTDIAAAAEGTSKLVDAAADRSYGHKLLVVASNPRSDSPDSTAVAVVAAAIAPCGPCSVTAAAEAKRTRSARTSVTAQTQAQERAPPASVA
jgi:hypothetical protein